MTEKLTKYLETKRHPSVEYWFSKLNEAFKRNTVAFQAAFGILSFGSLTGFMYALRDRPELGDFVWFALWALTFAVYIIIIQLEHWKNNEELNNEQRRIDIKAKDKFNTRFITWLYTRAAEKSDEDALDLFERGMVVFGAIPTDTVNKQLTQMMMMMNDVFFHMQPAVDEPTKEKSEPSETRPDISSMDKEEKLDFITKSVPNLDKPDLSATD